MVRDVCMVIVTLTMVGMVGYMIVSDVQRRREIQGFQDRVVSRLAGAQWEAFPLPPEVDG